MKKKHLNKFDLDKILACAKKRGLRDYLLILLSYRHGLRSIEATLLQYSWIDTVSFSIWIERVKGSISGSHPLQKDEVKLIRRLRQQKKSEFLFPFTTARVRQICKEISKDCGINFHHHQLRHTCGYNMAVKGIDSLLIKNYLGHRSIANTMIYINAAGQQFNKLPQWWL